MKTTEGGGLHVEAPSPAEDKQGYIYLVTVTLTVTIKNQNAKPALAVAFKQQFCSPRLHQHLVRSDPVQCSKRLRNLGKLRFSAFFAS